MVLHCVSTVDCSILPYEELLREWNTDCKRKSINDSIDLSVSVAARVCNEMSEDASLIHVSSAIVQVRQVPNGNHEDGMLVDVAGRTLRDARRLRPRMPISGHFRYGKVILCFLLLISDV